MRSTVARLLRRIRGDVALPAPQPAIPAIPDGELYRPVYSPWLGEPRFMELYEHGRTATHVSPDRCWVLLTLAEQALGLDGELWECGVYKGGTAAMLVAQLARAGSSHRLRLFDTFTGMPATDPERDLHQAGDFADTDLQSVRKRVGHEHLVEFHQGLIPATFAGLERSTVALAHIDTDIYRSVLDCCRFIWPRLARGGFMVFDDYGFPTCPGARQAVDEFFAGTRAVPLALPTGQALVFK